MFTEDQYQLLDFGQNQKLERFAGCSTSRTTPSAPGRKQQPQLWQAADLSYDRQRKTEPWMGAAPEPWQLNFGDSDLCFELRTAATGQVGVFPEQAVNWDWILDSPIDLSKCRALNLFAYTGGSTLALASRGASVTHVDAAPSVVKWARRNAELSKLAEHPIRWIVEDAAQFVAREIKRGNQYDIIVADPPSFGRGPKGQTWKLQRDLPTLMFDLSDLLTDDAQMLIFSSHTPSFEQRQWQQLVGEAFSLPAGDSEAFEFALETPTGTKLPSGHCFRWQRATN